MRDPVKVKTEVEITMDVDMIARAFAGMDDDQQAQFFVCVAEIAQREYQAPWMQWHAIGSHLRTCKCSSADARLMVKEIHDGMEEPSHA